MKRYRLHIARFATFLVALQILNLGFFVQDFQQLPSVSIIDHNVINSIVEYVSEVVLENTNAIPENDNTSNKDLLAHKHVSLKMVELKQPTMVVSTVYTYKKQDSAITDSYSYHFFKEINPPPPKA